MRAASFGLLCLTLAACSASPPKAKDAIVFEHSPHLREGASCTSCHSTLAQVPIATLPDAGVADDDAGVELEGAASDAPVSAERYPRLDEEPAATPGAGSYAKLGERHDARAASAEQQHASGAPPRPLPKEATCRGCHKGPDDSRCGYCHLHPESAATYPDRPHSIRFDHGKQIPEHVRDCMRCHGYGLSDGSVASFEPRLPPMKVCTESCHAADMSALECSKCHLGLSAYSREELSIVRHAPGFMRQHGAQARAEGGLCAQCHEPTFCTECHTATPNMPRELLRATEMDREFIHAADFQARHPAEARLDQASCLRCHGVDFCDGCHQASGVGGGVGPGSPHPPGWLDAMSGNSHAVEARRNILSCAGCHESDAEQTCVPCHRVGSIAGNPHPPGFGNGYDKNQQGVCRVCHGAGG